MRSASNCKTDQALGGALAETCRIVEASWLGIIHGEAYRKRATSPREFLHSPSAVCDPLEPRATPFFLTDKNLGHVTEKLADQINSPLLGRGARAPVRGSFIRLPFKLHRSHVALFESDRQERTAMTSSLTRQSLTWTQDGEKVEEAYIRFCLSAVLGELESELVD